jgi:hypothetical protein
MEGTSDIQRRHVAKSYLRGGFPSYGRDAPAAPPAGGGRLP